VKVTRIAYSSDLNASKLAQLTVQAKRLGRVRSLEPNCRIGRSVTGGWGGNWADKGEYLIDEETEFRFVEDWNRHVYHASFSRRVRFEMSAIFTEAAIGDLTVTRTLPL